MGGKRGRVVMTSRRDESGDKGTGGKNTKREKYKCEKKVCNVVDLQKR